MEIKTLYKTVSDGKITVSPKEPQGGYTTTYRIVASEGALITNGDCFCSVIDTDNPNDWTEVEENPQELILAILLGGAS